MLLEQTCHLLVQLADPLLDPLQLLKRQAGQRRGISFSLSQGLKLPGRVGPTSGSHLPCSQFGFQYCSSVPKPGSYCAVDSIPTSSTCCWIIHSANSCGLSTYMDGRPLPNRQDEVK